MKNATVESNQVIAQKPKNPKCLIIILGVIGVLIFTGVVGVGAYILGMKAGRAIEAERRDTQASTVIKKEEVTTTTTTITEAEDPYEGWETLNSTACNLSFALPPQSFYEAKTYEGSNAENADYLWVYEDTDNLEITGDYFFMSFKPEKNIWIGNFPNGEWGYGCGAGCVQETIVFVSCAQDLDTLDNIWSRMETGIAKANEGLTEESSFHFRKVLSTTKTSKWGFEILEIKTNTVLDVPSETFYLFTNGETRYLVNSYGPNADELDKIFGTFKFSN